MVIGAISRFWQGLMMRGSMKKTINPTQADFERIVTLIPEETPVTSLNLIKFREQAVYPEDKDFEPCTGREAYQRYLDMVRARVVGGQQFIFHQKFWKLSYGKGLPTWNAGFSTELGSMP